MLLSAWDIGSYTPLADGKKAQFRSLAYIFKHTLNYGCIKSNLQMFIFLGVVLKGAELISCDESACFSIRNKNVSAERNLFQGLLNI